METQAISTVARGSAFENLIANQLEGSGWIVGNRRHKGGPGDLLAHHTDGRVWLIECKTTARSAMADFGPAKREEMRKAAADHDLSAWLVWRAPGGPVVWYPEEGWP